MVFLSIVLAVAVAEGSGEQARAPGVDPMAQVRELLDRLDGVKSIRTVKRSDGSLQVRLQRKQGNAVPLIWRDGMQRASYTYWGSDLSFILSPTKCGLRLDCLQNVVTPVSGPFKTRNTYVKSLSLEVDDRGVPYWRSSSVFWGPLGREHWRESILTECNLPTDQLLKQVKNQDGMTQLQNLLALVQKCDQISIKRNADGKLDVSISGPAAKQIAVNRKVGVQTITSIDLGKDVSFCVSSDGKEVKFEKIENVKINVEVLMQNVTVELKSVVLSREKDGSTKAKVEVTNPLAPGKTLFVPVELKDLSLDSGKQP